MQVRKGWRGDVSVRRSVRNPSCEGFRKERNL